MERREGRERERGIKRQESGRKGRGGKGWEGRRTTSIS